MIRQFWQGQWRTFWMMSFVFALLLLFLHIFVLASKLTTNAADGVREKLGVYFYVKDAAQVWSGVTEEQLAAKIIWFKEKLEKWGVKVTFYSKEDALKNLQNRLPNMIENFDDYGIDNPLPATLYTSFANQWQYDFVMQTKSEYDDMLLTGPTNNMQEQFSRNARLINLLQVLQFFFLFIIAACVVVVLVFLGMIIKTKFSAMHDTISIQKLLWSPFMRLKKPFFYNILLVLLVAYILTAILSAVLLTNLASIFPYLFGMELKQIFGTAVGYRVWWLLWEVAVLMILSLFYANWQLSRLLKQTK